MISHDSIVHIVFIYEWFVEYYIEKNSENNKIPDNKKKQAVKLALG